MLISPALLLGLCGVQATQQPAASALVDTKVRWAASVRSPQTDWVNRVIELPDGEIAIAGFTGRDDERPGTGDWSGVIQRYSPDGCLLADVRLDRPGLDAPWALTASTAGTLAVAGISDAGGAGEQDMHLTTISDAGAIEWERWYGGPRDDRATDVVRLPDEGYMLVGQTESLGAGERDVFLVRTDPKGRELWRRAFGTPGVDRAFFAARTDGGIVVSGVTGLQGNYDFLLMKVALDGRLLWKRTVQGQANDANHGVVRLVDGTIVFVGYGDSWGGRSNDISILRFKPDGQLERHDIIGGAGDDRAQFAASAPDGSVWIVGSTKSFSNSWQMLVARVSPRGDPERWIGTIGGRSDVNGTSIAIARNGDLLLGGYVRGVNAEAPDGLVLRLEASSLLRRDTDVTVRSVKNRCEGSLIEMICS